jgi:hypothetical protein
MPSVDPEGDGGGGPGFGQDPVAGQSSPRVGSAKGSSGNFGGRFSRIITPKTKVPATKNPTKEVDTSFNPFTDPSMAEASTQYAREQAAMQEARAVAAAKTRGQIRRDIKEERLVKAAEVGSAINAGKAEKHNVKTGLAELTSKKHGKIAGFAHKTALQAPKSIKNTAIGVAGATALLAPLLMYTETKNAIKNTAHEAEKGAQWVGEQFKSLFD